MRAIFESIKNVILLVLAIIVVLSLYTGIMSAKTNIESSATQLGKSIESEMLIFAQNEKTSEVSFSVYNPVNLYAIGLEEQKVGTKKAIEEGANTVKDNSFYIPLAVLSSIDMFEDKSEVDNFPICIQRIYRLTLDPSIGDKREEIFQAFERFADGSTKALTCYYLLNKYPNSQLVAKWFLLFGNKDDPLVDCYFRAPYYACISPLPISVCTKLGGNPYSLAFCAFYNDIYPAEIKKEDSNYTFRLYLDVNDVIGKGITSNLDEFINKNLFSLDNSGKCVTSSQMYGLGILTETQSNHYYALNQFTCAKLNNKLLDEAVKSDFAYLISKEVSKFLGTKLVYALRFVGFTNTLNTIQTTSEVTLSGGCNSFNPTVLDSFQLNSPRINFDNDNNNVVKRLNTILKTTLCNSKDYTTQLKGVLEEIENSNKLSNIVNLYLILKANKVSDSSNDCTTSAKAKTIGFYYKNRDEILKNINSLVESINNFSRNVRLLKIILSPNPKCINVLLNGIESADLDSYVKRKIEAELYPAYVTLMKQFASKVCNTLSTNTQMLEDLFNTKAYSSLSLFREFLFKYLESILATSLMQNIIEIDKGNEKIIYYLYLYYNGKNKKAEWRFYENSNLIAKVPFEECLK